MPPVEVDEEGKEGKVLNFFNSKQIISYPSNFINENKSWKTIHKN